MDIPFPFYPGTKLQYAWNSSSLGLLKECPRKYQYSIIEGWSSSGLGVHIRFGHEYHLALEVYDRLRIEGASHDDAEAQVVRQALINTWDGDAPWAPEHAAKNRQTLIRSIVWYLETFIADPAKTIVLPSGKPAVELSFRFDTGVKPATIPLADNYILAGHIDRIVDYGGQIFVTDRKTTGSTISPHFFDSFSPDNQMSLYTLAARVVYDSPVQGVMIDGAQIAVGFTKFERGFTHRTQEQLDEWWQDFRHQMVLAEAFAREDHWPMNDKSCGNYGGCQFRKICSKSPQVRQVFLESAFTVARRNPLEA